MEDSFKVRVDRAFGSLQHSSSSIKPTTASLSSLWCLTDEEIQRNQWIQDKVKPHKPPKDPTPFLQDLLNAVSEPSTSHQDLESDIQELDDDLDDHSNEDLDIRTSMGMDCTLDKEEEVDAYDKVAIGRDEPADRFYMRDVNDYEVEIDSNNELPNAFTDVIRDSRANHIAAKLRLKEDDESATKLDPSFGGDPMENQITSYHKDVAMDESEDLSGVPDYVLNPSKYTHYTFDSTDDVDEAANRKAYIDFFNSLKGTGGMETQRDVSTDSHMPIVFTPRKKSNDGLMRKNKVDGYEEYMQKKVSIAVADIQDSMMGEDEAEIATHKSSSMQKGGRRYRTKGSARVE